jgi:DNA-binding GntR family transcriptional regulator
MQKIEVPENLTALAHRQIKNYILEGRLDEGGRLTEESLSTQLGISKSPVREALNRLEAEGLIRIEPRRGAYLRTLTEDEVADLYDYREALEVHAVLTAEFSPEVLMALRATLPTLGNDEAAEDKSRYIAQDIGFHATLVGATRNLRLQTALENLHDQLRILRNTTYSLSSHETAPLHAQIVDLLERGDRQAAAAVMRDHMRIACAQLLRYVRAREAGGVQDIAVGAGLAQ